MNRAAAYVRLIIGMETASVSGVERALADGASVDGTDGLPAVCSQFPPICFAANRGYVDIIEVLVHRGADLEIAAGDGCDSTGTVVFGFDSGSNKIPLNRSRALHAAIYGGKLEALRVLLEAGANPNSTDADGSTPLMVASGGYNLYRLFGDAEQRFEMLRALLGAGADPTVKGMYGALAIHFAACIGATQAVEFLLTKAPSTINVTDNYKCTPLAVAASHGKASTVVSLLSAGAREPAVWTPGFIKSGALLAAVEYDQQAVVRLLLEQGLEAIGGVLVVPEAISHSIQWGFIGILQVLLNVEGEERQEFWANHPVFPRAGLITAEFPAGTALGRVNAILAAKFRIPLIHVAARCCSLRAASVLLSAGADEAAVDTGGNCASDLVGGGKADDQKDAAKEGGFRRMLQRGPAFRARSWTWAAETEPKVGVAPDMALSAASSVQRSPIVRRFRPRARGGFSSRCARYGAGCGYKV